ncbi:MAG: Tfp pilus assembly protein FimT/FimU [Lachnospiraceae bacterium]
MRWKRKKDNKICQVNQGFTMLEMIVTVALVSIFFGAIAVAIPKNLQTYLMEKRLAKGLEMSTIIENGLAQEFGAASGISIVTTEDGTYLSYVKNVKNGDAMTTRQCWFPANYTEDDVTVSYSDEAVHSNTSSSLESQPGQPIVFTSKAIYLTAEGKPQIFQTILDEDFYDDMEAEITVYYDAAGNNMSMKVRIYDGEGTVCTTEKAILLYH